MEHCPEHSTVMESLGTIKGQNELLLKGQELMFQKIEGLTINGAVAKVENANTRERFKPFYWFLSIAGAAIVVAIVGVIAKKVF